jgi:hypothetical protein
VSDGDGSDASGTAGDDWRWREKGKDEVWSGRWRWPEVAAVVDESKRSKCS